MDNLVLFYRSRYKVAEDYAHAGEDEKCLDICWELRLDPHVGLYRRARVNLLIACVTDIRDYPDKEKYAQECIDLQAEIRRTTGIHPDSEADFVRFEEHAKQTLVAIESERQEAKKLADEAKATGSKEWNPEEEFRAEDGWEDGYSTQEPVEPWSIEGMYTSHHTNPQTAEAEPKSKEETEQVESKVEDTKAEPAT